MSDAVMGETGLNRPGSGDMIANAEIDRDRHGFLTPLDRLLHERTTRRLALAQHRVAPLLDATCDEPFDLAVIGSLAAGTFALHSDVDLLVRGDVDSAGRVRVEQAVAAAMRGSGIPYDLIFAADLTPARRAEFEHDLVEPSRLRETWAETRTHLPGIA